ncbi:MAG: DUF3368 domain-containing protein [Mariniphaga sp.]|nr:DUF3368 domain-containing protein [Mariniphaga sp.]
MPEIVSNTTPLISLLKIDKLNLLKEIYRKISVPNAVFKELEQGKQKAYYQDISKINWIRIVDIKNKEIGQFLFDLDEGEAEAIILAKELNADLLILDEKLGRDYAKKLNIKITGTLGVLLKAKEMGLIDSVRELLNVLVDKGVWLNPKLIEKVIKLAGEQK